MAEPISILNDVLGPVMRGPSSSHTAGSYHLARLAADLLGGRVARARMRFDRGGSYGRVFRQQGVDRAFAVGLLGWPLTDDRFFEALTLAPAHGLDLAFEVATLEGTDHPNDTDIELVDEGGGCLRVRARSVGGGAVEVVRVGDWPVRLTGQQHVVLVETVPREAGAVGGLLEAGGQLLGRPDVVARGDRTLVVARQSEPLAADFRSALGARPGVTGVREARPLAFVKRGSPMAASGADLVRIAEARGWSLGRVALEYEAVLLGIDPCVVVAEITRRFAIMRGSVEAGLAAAAPPMQLLEPSAGAILAAEAGGRLLAGGPHTRAAARAMAVMHTNGAMGVVCAAPTGGSAGALPGVVVTLADEFGVDADRVALALLAASAIGVVVATRATFAAEVAGCQVEIGAAGAMAAAAVVEAAGGTAGQATDAAAIALQNAMGSVCDLVQGMVEIPCHTRNAVAASSAFVCADLVMGGYRNPIPLDETIDAVYAVGRMLPAELRCTSRGGLAMAPSAVALERRRPAGKGPRS